MLKRCKARQDIVSQVVETALGHVSARLARASFVVYKGGDTSTRKMLGEIAIALSEV